MSPSKSRSEIVFLSEPELRPFLIPEEGACCDKYKWNLVVTERKTSEELKQSSPIVLDQRVEIYTEATTVFKGYEYFHRHRWSKMPVELGFYRMGEDEFLKHRNYLLGYLGRTVQIEGAKFFESGTSYEGVLVGSEGRIYVINPNLRNGIDLAKLMEHFTPSRRSTRAGFDLEIQVDDDDLSKRFVSVVYTDSHLLGSVRLVEGTSMGNYLDVRESYEGSLSKRIVFELAEQLRLEGKIS